MVERGYLEDWGPGNWGSRAPQPTSPQCALIQAFSDARSSRDDPGQLFPGPLSFAFLSGPLCFQLEPPAERKPKRIRQTDYSPVAGVSLTSQLPAASYLHPEFSRF